MHAPTGGKRLPLVGRGRLVIAMAVVVILMYTAWTLVFTELALHPLGAIVWYGGASARFGACLSTDGGVTAAVVPLLNQRGAALRGAPFTFSGGRFVYWSAVDTSLCVLAGSGRTRRWIDVADPIMRQPHVYVVDLTPWPNGVALNLVDQRTWSRIGAVAVRLTDGSSKRIAGALAVRGADGSDSTCLMLASGRYEARRGNMVTTTIACNLRAVDWDYAPQGPTVCVTDGRRIALLRGNYRREWNAPCLREIRGVLLGPGPHELLAITEPPFCFASVVVAYSDEGKRLGNRLRAWAPVRRPLLAFPRGVPPWWAVVSASPGPRMGTGHPRGQTPGEVNRLPRRGRAQPAH